MRTAALRNAGGQAPAGTAHQVRGAGRACVGNSGMHSASATVATNAAGPQGPNDSMKFMTSSSQPSGGGASLACAGPPGSSSSAAASAAAAACVAAAPGGCCTSCGGSRRGCRHASQRPAAGRKSARRGGWVGAPVGAAGAGARPAWRRGRGQRAPAVRHGCNSSARGEVGAMAAYFTIARRPGGGRAAAAAPTGLAPAGPLTRRARPLAALLARLGGGSEPGPPATT